MPFRIITQPTDSRLQMNQRGRTSASECGPAGQLVLLRKAPPPPSALSGWVATGTGSAQVTSRSFVFLPPRLPPRALIGLLAEERPRSADQVT